MGRMAKLVAALFATLLLGFGVGEWFGPDEAAASGCSYKACHYIGLDYYCEPSGEDTDCVWDGDFCTTVACDTGCDPEEPDCEPDPD